MKYPVIIHKDEDTGYGVTIPDIPGCFAYGDTQEEAILNIQEAVELYYHGEDISDPPAPSQMEDLLNSDLYTRDSFLYLADIDFAFIAPKTQRINITVPEYKLIRIDRAVKARGISRSAFFVDSAEQYIRNLGVSKTIGRGQKKSVLSHQTQQRSDRSGEHFTD
ncbi:MAG: type II toxin-antitoxin system HicB family antitoxin [Deltaproteobacteria bacterium]|uniref:type II toxin-antitoxin system HicB family antitoxin n=1 Tax=Desulfobacula sp. TaxID=2593537 RepID=UPI0019B45C51|nr:type II toxin-antitoxin system HicB family antitoxin [Candidatus Desulfobacula maris]MBL6994450.1 type II toxin-antitoxin system HicB family antitoxin [Desulfobacula sp.]